MLCKISIPNNAVGNCVWKDAERQRSYDGKVLDHITWELIEGEYLKGLWVLSHSCLIPILFCRYPLTPNIFP